MGSNIGDNGLIFGSFSMLISKPSMETPEQRALRSSFPFPWSYFSPLMATGTLSSP